MLTARLLRREPLHAVRTKVAVLARGGDRPRIAARHLPVVLLRLPRAQVRLAHGAEIRSLTLHEHVLIKNSLCLGRSLLKTDDALGTSDQLSHVARHGPRRCDLLLNIAMLGYRCQDVRNAAAPNRACDVGTF